MSGRAGRSPSVSASDAEDYRTGSPPAGPLQRLPLRRMNPESKLENPKLIAGGAYVPTMGVGMYAPHSVENETVPEPSLSVSLRSELA